MPNNKKDTEVPELIATQSTLSHHTTASKLLESKQVLIVDLNNFARYPTLAIGYITQNLRQHGAKVQVLSPLAFGAPPFEREQKETWLEHAKRRVYFSTHQFMLPIREGLRRLVNYSDARPHITTQMAVKSYLERNSVDIILLSAYLNHRQSVELIAKHALTLNIPVLLGGPAFNQLEVTQDWLQIPGVSAIFGGECDLVVASVVNAILNKADLTQFQGLFLPNNPNGVAAPPLHDIDQLPCPDYTDFPWQSYPHRIIPVMTGRGCSWGVCTFCSDVVTANGRGFRSRSPKKIMQELVTLADRHQTKDFIFLDLKLNSNLHVWRTLINTFQNVIPGGKWIATVHVDGKKENGLTQEELLQAKASGLVRMSFGLETGSQRLNDSMAKGTKMERNHEFVRNTSDAGISLRASMMLGYPGETADDIQLSIAFLEEHFDHFDRIRMSLFKPIPGTAFAAMYESKSERFPGLKNLQWDYRYNRASYEYTPASEKSYRKARAKLLDLVHKINRKPLRDNMQQFDGLM